MAATALVLHPRAVEDEVARPARSLSFSADLSHLHGISIFVLPPGGDDMSLVPLRVLNSDTIAAVKARIQASRGFQRRQQRLVYEGRELFRDDSRVRDYGISDGQMLHVVMKISGLLLAADLVHGPIQTTNCKSYALSAGRPGHLKTLKEQGKEQILFQSSVYIQDHTEKTVEDNLHSSVAWRADVRLLAIHTTADIQSILNGGQVEVSQEISNITLASLSPSLVAACKWPRIPSTAENILSKHIHTLALKEVDPALQLAVAEAEIGLQLGHSPQLCSDGSGGTYFLSNSAGNVRAVFKPLDEEPLAANNPRGLPVSSTGEGLKAGTRVGEGALREVAAYLLDYPNGHDESLVEGLAGVPPTVMVCCYGEFYSHHEKKSSWKVGSFQEFVHAYSNCEDMGPAKFPVKEVQKLAVLDIRLANTDRNGENILVCGIPGDDMSTKLVPIDHGYCLPEKFEDCTFEWLNWSQSQCPFSDDICEYIAGLDAERDLALLVNHGWSLSPQCARVLRISTALLKKGSAAGLSPDSIGSMMCRTSLSELSEIEKILEAVEESVLPGSSEEAFLEKVYMLLDNSVQKLAKSHLPTQ
eukprot:SM000225S07026  [mRNA]  locus=s225:146212:148866:- [translate_table: standard]